MNTNRHEYVHGYSERENERLVDQATTLTELLHNDTHYPAGNKVLEAGCGVGAQTVTLAAKSPGAEITSIDISEKSLKAAQDRVKQAGYSNVTFQQADIFNLPFEDKSFDHLFLCFVLEHLPSPKDALQALMKKLKQGGTVTVVEGDHGSTYFYPNNPFAQKTIQCLVDLQAKMGGNSLIGRELYPILTAAGLNNVSVSPRMVYADSSRPQLVQGFTLNTFTAMVEGVKGDAMKNGLMSEKDWQKGIDGLKRCARPDGVFCYTFFKAVAIKS